MNYGFEMVCTSVFTVFCIILARFYSFINRAYSYWDKKKISGPSPHYIVGTWSGFSEKFLGCSDFENVLKYGRVYGTYDGLTPNLIVTDPELIKEIVTASSEKLQDFRFLSENSVILKDSLLSLCAAENSEIQILMNSLLGPHKLEKLFLKLKLSAETLISNIAKAPKEDGLVNVTSCVSEYIDEVIATAVFGIELNADLRFKDEFIRNTKHIFKIKSSQSIWSLLPFLYENYFKESWVCPEKVLQYFVNLLIARIKESSSEAILTEVKGKPSNLIELMVKAANEEKELLNKDKKDESSNLVLTDNVIISKCLASMLSLASITKTTVLLGIYALANDLEVQEKLHKDIKNNISEGISYESVKNLNYLDKVVKEVLRLYPFEFRLEKVVTSDIKLGDVDLDKNVRVSVPLYALHRLEEFYEGPHKFDPERFSQSASEKRNSYTYLPFGQAGLNGSDISLQLGIFASKITLLKLIEKFKFSTIQQLSLSMLFQKGFTGIPQPERIKVFVEIRM